MCCDHYGKILFGQNADIPSLMLANTVCEIFRNWETLGTRLCA